MCQKIFFYLLLCIHSVNTHFILLGPPGSGKGTFSEFMIKQKNYKQISIGDIIRYHKKHNTILGQQIAQNNGFVTDEVAYQIIKDEIIEAINQKEPMIIDGFPRNTDAFNFLIHTLQELKALDDTTFVYFKINDQACIDRINNRLVCFNCQHVFNLTTHKPKKGMICDKCHSNLEKRDGDDTATTIKRLKYYREHTEPLIKEIEQKYKLITIDSSLTQEKCLQVYSSL